MSKRQVVIIGGGFSGAAVAIHLARAARPELEITVVEPRAQVGQGVAYSTIDAAHRINVPAEKMALSPAEQDSFEHWFEAVGGLRDDPEARWHDGKIYPRRNAFGRYMAEKFVQAASGRAGNLRHLQDRAVDWRNGVVVTEKGVRLKADEVVLAISHPRPSLPRPLAQKLANHPGLIADPWRNGALDGVAATDRVAIIGTGLTMADMAASLHSRGHRGSIVAFSRHGLLSRPNITEDFPDWTPAAAPTLPNTPRGWLRRIRQDIRRAAAQRLPWQKVLDEIRTHGQQLWQQWPLVEQRRFLRHLRAYWDAHRYRIAPQVSALLAQQQAAGGLRVLAARLQQAAADSDNVIALTLRPRGGPLEMLYADKLIVTTGPAHGTLLDSNPLFRALARRGELRADPLGLGLLVNEDSQAINQHGRANPHLLVAGPAARGRFGELIGFPQVADHAEAIAQRLLAAAASAAAQRCPASS
ncbi:MULTISPECIES: FAD/NAD(P)-binding protein [unclassified Brenneria]|uniref:FAD/NAD(P)-binding protein n=1 Tax=unclassified Brenneria TaxID=2634434 RepID=UPI001552A26F|nr:FAD-dependent oxidoreductase [Brenneria sp. hezel4-2-4]MEE3651069.1 FAD-dependent oxidoreductase [Brenneria sp. HEZEL_4_2_4]NPD01024.1 FAD-dependent oxidoreductase [Brenneria sp. hezel4-2-4]